MVVSAIDGCMSQTREQIRLARNVGVSAMVVFLNKTDLVDDLDLMKLAETEVRELLTLYDFPGDNIPVVTGSAAQALACGCGKRDCPWCGQIFKLMDQVDRYIPLPTSSTEEAFLLTVEDVCAPNGRGGTMATGRVRQGCLHVGDMIEIIGFAVTVKSTIVIAILKAFRDSVVQAVAGDEIGVLTYGLTQKDLIRGQVLAKPEYAKPHTTFKAELYVLHKDETYQRNIPIDSGYYQQFHILHTDVLGRVTLPTGMKTALQGTNMSIIVELTTPLAIEERLQFLISVSGLPIAIGIVVSIIQ